MQIIIKNGDDETILAAGSQRAIGSPVGPDGLSLSGSIAHQLLEHLRGTAAKAEDRGNLRSGISWTSHYEFATQYAADIFTVTHASEVQRANEIRLVIANLDGGSDIISIANALVTDVAPVMRGVSVSVTYTAIGGKAERIET